MYYPKQYVIATWLRLKQWGEFPNGLPYDEQPTRLLADYARLDQRYGEIVDKLRADEHWQPETLAPFDVPPAPVVEDTPPEVGKKRRGLIGRMGT